MLLFFGKFYFVLSKSTQYYKTIILENKPSHELFCHPRYQIFHVSVFFSHCKPSLPTHHCAAAPTRGRR